MTPPKILPPHYFALSLALMIGLGLLDVGRLLPAPWPWLGLLPLAAGILLAVQGSRLFAKAATNIVPFSESTSLVTEGVFAFSRNPMYSGMLLALAGVALLLNSLFAALVIVPFYLIIRYFFIRHEEQLMETTFGDRYLEYKARVRRWV
jgi:protein-S-isoprenylcysteine O-methyltransferase Ste14